MQKGSICFLIQYLLDLIHFHPLFYLYTHSLVSKHTQDTIFHACVTLYQILDNNSGGKKRPCRSY